VSIKNVGYNPLVRFRVRVKYDLSIATFQIAGDGK
jgi:hypothetical protein